MLKTEEVYELLKRLAKPYYANRDNWYHSWDHHIEKMFEDLHRVYGGPGRIPYPEYVILMIAIAFHDCVYVPGASDNEKLSSDCFLKHAQELADRTGVCSTCVRSVSSQLIMTTIPFKDPKDVIPDYNSHMARLVDIIHDLDWLAFSSLTQLKVNQKLLDNEAIVAQGDSFDTEKQAANTIKFLEKLKDDGPLFRTPEMIKHNDQVVENIDVMIKTLKLKS